MASLPAIDRATFVFRLQITASATIVWQAGRALDTAILAEAMLLADRMALACRRAEPASRGTIGTWIVSIVGEGGRTLYQAPVACH